MSDPAEDIAEAMKTFLDAQEFSRECRFFVPVNPSIELYKEHAGTRCLIIPIGETEEKENRSTIFIQPEINLIFTAKVETDEDRKTLAGLVRAVSVALRFEAMAGYGWRKTETITKFDSELMKVRQYLAARTVTYQGLE